ncbi:hypothetical protein [Parafrankia sp. EUN1f]|uniref:hypothetical protein n=1 Tax=Parafrankia sp. EUN1f TaxID=102897 RepID=UPI0001C456FB|nr:hypothetical protein [Parafrankia sp. EUN1f]EFC78787.1 hypothetical protein FrEUN1fDRAFT_8094 [Parafrankia sp. EUN1f]
MDRQEPSREAGGGTRWVDSGAGPGAAADIGWLRPHQPDAGVLAVGRIERAVILRSGRGGPDLVIAPQAWERFLAEVRQGLYDNLLEG